MAKKSDQFKVEKSKDKRVRGSVQKLAAKLWELLTPKQVAKKLGVSTQKATAIKKGISSGKIYSPKVKQILAREVKRATPKKKTRVVYVESKPEKKPRKKPQKISKELRDFLKDQGISLREFRKQSRKIQKEIKQEFKDTARQVGKAGEVYYPTMKALTNDYRKYKTASYRHASYESALKWWKGVTGGAGYFVIVRRQSKKTGREIFFVMDIDPDRKRQGVKRSKKINNYQTDRALKLESQFLETEDF